MKEQMTLWEAQTEKPVRLPLPMRKPISEREHIFEWAKAHSFPYVQFPLGRGVYGTIQPGEENWRAFCEKADLYIIQIALRGKE